MSLNADVLQELINAGSDAQSNLFYVTLSNPSIKDDQNEDSLEKYSARITDFYAPEIKTSTASAPYLGVKYTLPAPSSPISKQITFTFRLDDNYELYEKLKEVSVADQNGILSTSDDLLTLSSPKKWNIQITAYKPVSNYSSSSNNLEEVYSWTFYNCMIVSIPQLSYSFNNARPLDVKVVFIYSYYTTSTI